MFAASYFAPRYFTDSYWTKIGVELPVEVPGNVSGPSQPMRQMARVDVRVKGRIITLDCSLLPGIAIGSAKAYGDLVHAVNVLAAGAPIDAPHWQLLAGTARAQIVLSEDEEFILLFSEAA